MASASVYIGAALHGRPVGTVALDRPMETASLEVDSCV